MPQRDACILENTDVLETIQNLYQDLNKDYIMYSLEACLNCIHADRTEVVNLHGHLQGLHTMLSHILDSIDTIKNR